MLMIVSLVIVNWNGKHFLSECLDGLRKQRYISFEIIVVNNGSNDGSVPFIKSRYPEVRIIALPQNLGFAAANNRALFGGTTEFVALLNSDVFPEPDWLERLIAAAGTHPEVAAFGSRQLCQGSPEVLDGTGDSYHMSGLAWRERHGARQQAEDLVAREIFSPCAAAALYRRQALVDAGGFDEDFFCYVEDVDLGFRLRLAGHKAMYVPDAVVHHVGSATTGGQRSDFSVYHGHRNLVWTFVKNMPGALFWLLLPMHMALNLASILWFSMRGQGRVILKAKRDALFGIPRMWRKRRNIQANRVASIGEIWKALDKRIF